MKNLSKKKTFSKSAMANTRVVTLKPMLVRPMATAIGKNPSRQTVSRTAGRNRTRK